MGCGQSKINLYPRRNKNGGKGNSAKKSGAAEKEADEEEGSAGAAGGAGAAEGAGGAATDEDDERAKQILPLAVHPPPVEISASQQDFFKMLDEKIDMGRDYDSSSETEIHIEKERRRVLIDQWRSTSQSSCSQSSPPTPARRRAARPPPPARRHSPGAARRCYRQQPHTDTASPPSRKAHSAQGPQPSERVNGEWLRDDSNKSPVKRPQSAGPNWKNNPKVAPYNHKPKKGEASEQRDPNPSGDMSQITYNPTFQSHSPAHAAQPTQPYIAQIIAYPMSQQVTPPSPPKYIAPPEEYQDPQNHLQEAKYANPRQTSPTPSAQSGIYYIHGGATPTAQDLAQQRQQTALHLQQYVAMKQAQQQMYTYLQRSPHTVFPNMDFSQMDPNKVYEEQFAQYTQTMSALRPHSAPGPGPAPVGVALPPGYEAVPASLTAGGWAAAPPGWVPGQAMPPGWVPGQAAPPGGWVPGQVAPDAYFPPPHYYRPHSAGSAGTLTRYHKPDAPRSNVCQSINIVRQKPVGQIVVGGAQELTICTNSSDSPSPASVSTDSGVSPGAPPAPPAQTSAAFTSSTKDLIANNLDSKNKKNKTPHIQRTLKNSKSLDSS